MVVTDTHALLWFLSGDKKLGKQAASYLKAVEAGNVRLVIPIVVMMEILVITEKKRVETSWAEILEKIFKFPDYVIYPIDTEVLFEVKKMNQKLELHDRIIAATAKLLKAPLLTVDPEIINYTDVEIVWG